MRIFGFILPYIGRVIGPCDGDGNPAMGDDEANEARHECVCLCLAWFGFATLIPLGGPEPRAVDPDNPRQYLAGNL